MQRMERRAGNVNDFENLDEREQFIARHYLMVGAWFGGLFGFVGALIVIALTR